MHANARARKSANAAALASGLSNGATIAGVLELGGGEILGAG
jgi:hypothetical protein